MKSSEIKQVGKVDLQNNDIHYVGQALRNYG